MHYNVSRLIALVLVCASAQFAKADLILHLDDAAAPTKLWATGTATLLKNGFGTAPIVSTSLVSLQRSDISHLFDLTPVAPITFVFGVSLVTKPNDIGFITFISPNSTIGGVTFSGKGSTVTHTLTASEKADFAGAFSSTPTVFTVGTGFSNPGVVSVVAVPEPSSGCVLLLLSSVVLQRRRRR
ncbi:MAG: hypothetical protein KDB03_04445 [Planctomycetales bacterium]|nr:hypothetical protein [Planctomycetales bacterium]